LNVIQSNLSEAEKANVLNFIKQRNANNNKNLNLNNNKNNLSKNYQETSINERDKIDKHDKVKFEETERLFNKNMKTDNDIDKNKSQDMQDIREHYFKTFPIDNNSFNFLIVDSNLAIKDNLNNIFFIEFDLAKDQSDLETLKVFTEINNEKVNKDISFTLNVSRRNFSYHNLIIKIIIFIH